ncbi:ribonuclease P protein subunit p38 [Arapaima gigas]
MAALMNEHPQDSTMSTPGKSAKKEKKKPIPVKTSLNNPYSLRWHPLNREDMHFILSLLKDKLSETGLQKREAKDNRRWFGKKKENSSSKASVPEPEQKVAETPGGSPKGKVEHGWTDVALRKELAIGINEVTRGLERNELSLVLVCKSVQPAHMTIHLIQLSASRAVPACQVPRLSETLSGPLGLRCVLALGIRKDAVVFSGAVGAIVPRVPPLQVAGASPKAVKAAEEGSVAPEPTDTTGEGVTSRKRKMEESPSALATLETSPIPSLKPLKVKKIIPNPTKVRKPKKQKIK